MSTMTVQSARGEERRRRRQALRKQDSHATHWSAGFIAKLVLMALVNALGVYIIFNAILARLVGDRYPHARPTARRGLGVFSKRTLA